VIRNTIHQRYAQTHYLYTAFKHATETGTPILRPTWYEFPEDTKTFDKSTQFMFGDNFLVSPKKSSPSEMHRVFHAPVDVEVYLPPSTNWYSYYSKQLIP
jgi:alpha-glucosidase